MDHDRASTSGSQQMPEPAPTLRPQEPKEVNEHIYQLYKPENGEPTMEILFFHGLQFGHSPDPPYLSTWRNEETKEVWPGTWLAEQFPHAHIFSVSYDASMRTTGEHGRLDLHNLAENLVQAICWADIGQGFGRPVIFVGHCFGGLAIKELLVQADQTHHGRGPGSERNQQIGNFLNNIGGVFFYGTPHHGSYLVDKAAYFLDGPLLRYVKLLSTESARLEGLFVSLCSKYNMHFIASVGESHETSWGIFHGLIVPEASARYGDFCTVAADHISLCKPAKKTSNSFQHLIRFIQRITLKVEGEASLEKIDPRVPKAAVGLDFRVEKVCKMLQRNTCTSLGIFGMGGVGKTTLARELLNKFGPTFECTCFVSVVKRIIGTVEDVKEEVWKQMHCGSKKIEHCSQVQGKKLLLVLDDVASERDIEVWEAIVDDIAPTSRLVVTSRDRELLKNMDDLYLVPFLNEEDAKQLFVNCAFPSPFAPPLTLEHHVDSIVKKCDGLPLTLEVLGKYLKGKENGELWKETLQSLDNADHVAGLDEKLWAKLKLSYISLQEEEQQMFLDVTTFFSLEDWSLCEAKAAWSVNYGLEHTRWQTLVDRSLVYDGEEDEPIKVHEQLQSLGRKLASDGKCIRSWKTMEGWNLLQSITDDQEIHSLRLSPFEHYHDDQLEDVNQRTLLNRGLSRLKNDHLEDVDQRPLLKRGLSTLKNLQYLDIVNDGTWLDPEPWSLRRLSKKAFDKPKPKTLSLIDLFKKMFPTKLVLLGSPTLQFGPILQLRHLVVLKLELPSDAKHVSSSIGQLSMLKILRIKARTMTMLPDEIGNLSQLGRLTFDSCDGLETLPETFGHLSNLQHLVFNGCWALHSLPDSFGQLHMLQHLTFEGCWNLQSLEIKTLPSSSGYLNALRHLVLRRTSLASIPDWIHTLPLLQILELGDMSKLEGLPPWLRESLPVHWTYYWTYRWDRIRHRSWKFRHIGDGHWDIFPT